MSEKRGIILSRNFQPKTRLLAGASPDSQTARDLSHHEEVGENEVTIKTKKLTFIMILSIGLTIYF